jgi:predicted GH43/DUF377 family glycosyl hydrolase
MKIRHLLFVLILCFSFLINGCEKENRKSAKEFGKLVFHVSDVSGIGYEAGIVRRDPSDIIEINGKFFVWYTRVVQAQVPDHLRTSGYPGTIWYAVSADSGHNWKEMGMALGKGKHPAFDSFGVFTPNIIAIEGKYYLYYTAVKPTPGTHPGMFENNSINDYTSIGIAVAESPHGPFNRIEKNPILSHTKKIENQPSGFDSYRVDDAALLQRNGQILLYYKGRNIDFGADGPSKTMMGLAVADVPQGPYKRQKKGKAVQSEGHEVMIWAAPQGVYSLVTSAGRGVYLADNGIDFNKLNAVLEGNINAPGAFRMELTDPNYKSFVQWGISMIHSQSPYLVRWSCTRQ